MLREHLDSLKPLSLQYVQNTVIAGFVGAFIGGILSVNPVPADIIQILIDAEQPDVLDEGWPG